MTTNSPGPTLPQFRLAILGRQITLSRWGPALAGLPMVSQLKALTESEADYADLRFIGDPGKRELLITFAGGTPKDASRAVLADWAATVGATRVWLLDELLDPRGDVPADAKAVVRYLSCGVEITATGEYFWHRVRAAGCFPSRCAMCGATVPQMRLIGDHAEAGEGRR
jgi:hypothetical protein